MCSQKKFVKNTKFEKGYSNAIVINYQNVAVSSYKTKLEEVQMSMIYK